MRQRPFYVLVLVLVLVIVAIAYPLAIDHNLVGSSDPNDACMDCSNYFTFGQACITNAALEGNDLNNITHSQATCLCTHKGFITALVNCHHNNVCNRFVRWVPSEFSHLCRSTLGDRPHLQQPFPPQFSENSNVLASSPGSDAQDSRSRSSSNTSMTAPTTLPTQDPSRLVVSETIIPPWVFIVVPICATLFFVAVVVHRYPEVIKERFLPRFIDPQPETIDASLQSRPSSLSSPPERNNNIVDFTFSTSTSTLPGTTQGHFNPLTALLSPPPRSQSRARLQLKPDSSSNSPPTGSSAIIPLLLRKRPNSTSSDASHRTFGPEPTREDIPTEENTDEEKSHSKSESS